MFDVIQHLVDQNEQILQYLQDQNELNQTNYKKYIFGLITLTSVYFLLKSNYVNDLLPISKLITSSSDRVSNNMQVHTSSIQDKLNLYQSVNEANFNTVLNNTKNILNILSRIDLMFRFNSNLNSNNVGSSEHKENNAIANEISICDEPPEVEFF